MLQLQIIIIIIALAVFDLIYRFVDKRNKRYNYSPIYLRIEKIYKKWYSQKISIVNNSKSSVIRIREEIFELVKELKADGIELKDIDNYCKLINELPKKNKWYTIIVSFLTAIGGSELAKTVSKNITESLAKIKVDSNSWVSIISSILLLVVLIYLFVRFTYILLMNDNSKRNSEKNAIFEEVKTLYNFDKVKKDNTELRIALEIAMDNALSPIKLNWLKDFCKGIINWGQNESVIRSMALLPLIAAFLLLLWLDYITVLLSLIQLGFWLLTVFLILATCILLIFIINYVYDWCNIKKSK